MSARLDVHFTLVAICVIFGSLLGIVVVQTAIVQDRVELDQVNVELEVARDINRQLRFTLIELEAPERVIDVAQDRLGMVRPNRREYLPGLDPALVEIDAPRVANPFGAAPITDALESRLAAVERPVEDQTAPLSPEEVAEEVLEEVSEGVDQ